MSNSQSASNKAAVCQRTNWKHRQPVSTPSRMGRVVKKLAATPKRRRPQVSRRRLTAPSPKSIRRLSKEALRQHLLNNSLDTAGTRQQMVSRLTTFIKAAKAHSKDQRQENKQAPDQRLEANNRESTPTSDSSEARDSIAIILALTAQKPQQSHLRNARGKGRGNAPLHQAPQKVTLAGKGIIDATVHPPPPRHPPGPSLARPALLVAATHAEESTSAATAEAGNTLR